jgi:hypothetical protein
MWWNQSRTGITLKPLSRLLVRSVSNWFDSVSRKIHLFHTAIPATRSESIHNYIKRTDNFLSALFARILLPPNTGCHGRSIVIRRAAGSFPCFQVLHLDRSVYKDVRLRSILRYARMDALKPPSGEPWGNSSRLTGPSLEVGIIRSNLK